MTVRTTIGELRGLIAESIEDEVASIEPGDLVDVALDYAYGPYRRIRVLKLVSDVGDAAGVTDVSDPSWNGPGFLGVNEDPENYDMEVGERGWFTMDNVIPKSKLKYYMSAT